MRKYVSHILCVCLTSYTATQVARANFEHAGVYSKINLIVGPAAETLRKLEPYFDLVFIDADKSSNTTYYKEARRLTKKGGVIVRGFDLLTGIVPWLSFSLSLTPLPCRW